MLVNLSKILDHANKHNYAVPAFNINNMEIAQAVIVAAVAEKSPVILQTSEGAIDYAGLDYLSAIAHTAAHAKVPVVFHVDHGKNFKLVKMLIKSGEYTSAMYDGSSLPYSENIRNTRELVKLAHSRRMTLEAELGAIKGTEDKVSVSERAAFFTDPKQALDFVRKTGCDALAISVGTAHGAYKFEDKTELDYKRIAEIKKLTKMPLVLHGASNVPAELVALAEHHGADLTGARGVADSALKKAVSLGVNKVNIDSDLRIAFVAGVREALDMYPSTIDPRKILIPARELMTKLARHKMRILGSSGRA
ncbi:MAG: ketose-bisphosphate aldolase [bacterium]